MFPRNRVRLFERPRPLEPRTREQPPRVSVCAELGERRPAAEPQAARWRPSGAELADGPAPGPVPGDVVNPPPSHLS